VPVERIKSELNNAVQGSRFLEQVCRARYNDKLDGSSQPCCRSLVQIQHLGIPATDNEHRRRSDSIKCIPRKVRPTSSRDHQLNMIGNRCGRAEGGRCACARAEERNRDLLRITSIAQQPNRSGQSRCQPLNIESELAGPAVHLIFLSCE
jgi:hypothetical protein